MSNHKPQPLRRPPIPMSQSSQSSQIAQGSTLPDSREQDAAKPTVSVQATQGYEMKRITITLPIAEFRDPSKCPPPRNVTVVRLPVEIGTLIQSVAEGMGDAGVAAPIGLSAAGTVRYILELIAKELRI